MAELRRALAGNFRGWFAYPQEVKQIAFSSKMALRIGVHATHILRNTAARAAISARRCIHSTTTAKRYIQVSTLSALLTCASQRPYRHLLSPRLPTQPSHNTHRRLSPYTLMVPTSPNAYQNSSSSFPFSRMN